MRTFKNIYLIILLQLISQPIFSQWELLHSFGTPYSQIDKCDVSFSDPQNGYAVSVGNHSPRGENTIEISKTTDFGNNWNTISREIGYINASEIVAIHPDTFFYFKNQEGICKIVYGYGTDRIKTQHVALNFPQDMFFINSKVGYLIAAGYGINKLIKFSPDSLTTLIAPDTIKLISSKIFFNNSQNGYLTARDYSDNNILLHTIDGGENWTKNYSTSNYTFNNLYFTSDSVGYIVCSGGKILKTTNFGKNVNEMLSITSSNLNDTQFLNDSCGYCIGDSGTCIYTTDYGNTWLNEPINTTQDLLKLNMFDMNIGYISSNNKLYGKNTISNIQTYVDEPFSIYPNPTSGYVHIKSGKEIDYISIYNVQGQEILQDNIDLKQIDMSNYESGLYLVIISIDNKQYLKKIIKK